MIRHTKCARPCDTLAQRRSQKTQCDRANYAKGHAECDIQEDVVRCFYGPLPARLFRFTCVSSRTCRLFGRSLLYLHLTFPCITSTSFIMGGSNSKKKATPASPPKRQAQARQVLSRYNGLYSRCDPPHYAPIMILAHLILHTFCVP